MFNVGFVAEAAPSMARACKRLGYGLAVLFLLFHLAGAAHAQTTEPITNLYAADNPANGTTLLTASPNEYNNVLALGWAGRGVIGAVLTSTVGSDVTPLYRLHNSANSDFLFTTDIAEVNRLIASHGYALEGVTGYVYTTILRDRSRRAMYRYSNSSAIHHFRTSFSGDPPAGFTYESTVFYVRSVSQ